MKKIFLIVSMILLAVVLSGCVISFGSQKASPAVLGVFKSTDRSETWVPASLFLHAGGTGSIAGVSVSDLVFDPQDYNALYLVANDGLIYSYDGGNSWQRANTPGGSIKAVAIDPGNKCVIYAGLNNTILKSVDCNRSWSEVYIDDKAEKLITVLAVDYYSNLIVYAGNSVGDILKSTDGGGTWRVINRFNNPIAKILMDSDDSRIIYMATAHNGIFKTTDGGVSWTDVNSGLKPYSGSFEYRHLIFDPTQRNSLLLVAKYGLLKSNDAGETWQPITLITPPATTDIFAVAISPDNNQEIYYTTASTFYKTNDGGQNWITKRLPTLGVPAVMLIDPTNANVIYLGVKASAAK